MRQLKYLIIPISLIILFIVHVSLYGINITVLLQAIGLVIYLFYIARRFSKRKAEPSTKRDINKTAVNQRNHAGIDRLKKFKKHTAVPKKIDDKALMPAQDMAEFIKKATNQEEGYLDHHLNPCKIDLIIDDNTSGKINSWVGGNPYFPDHLDWPIVNGVPGVFYMQLDCRELPPTLWNRMTPKEGWLIFFVSWSDCSGATVLHTKELGSERISPVPVEHYDRYPGYSKMYANLTKSAIMSAPRWFVKITPLYANGSPETDTCVLPRPGRQQWHEDNKYFKFQRSIDLTLPYYQPIDWLSTQALFESAQAYFENILIPQHGGSALSSNDDWFKRYSDLLNQLKTGWQRIDEIRQKEPFTDKVRQEVVLIFQNISMSTLGGSIHGYKYREGDMEPLPETLASNRAALEQYLGVFEVHLRHVYTRNPDALPLEHRKAFIEVWRFLADFEIGTMGGATHGGFPDSQIRNPAFLLELPSSYLLGWSFGDAASLGFFVHPDGLKALDFSDSWYDVLN